MKRGNTFEISAHLAARLRELRARKNLTQTEVGERCGCHESAVSRWECGSRFPTPRDLVRLADLFDVSTDDLLGRARQPIRGGLAIVHAAGWWPVPDGGAAAMSVTEAVERQAAKAATP